MVPRRVRAHRTTGAPQRGDDVDQQRLPSQRHHEAAGALDRPAAAPRAVMPGRVGIDLDTVDLGGEVRRSGGVQRARPPAARGRPRNSPRRRTVSESVSPSRPACTGFQYIAVEQSREPRAEHRLADVGVRARDHDGRAHAASRPRSAASPANRASTSCSSTLSVSEMRRRAVPSGTVGGRTARTSKPRRCRAAASDRAASIVADHDGQDLRAGRRRCAACERSARGGGRPDCASRSRRSGSSRRMSSASSAATAINGDGAVEKMKGRPRLTRKSHSTRGPEHERPGAAERLAAGMQRDHVVATLQTPRRGRGHRARRRPVACASSMSSIASCRSAIAASSASGARSPSML